MSNFEPTGRQRYLNLAHCITEALMFIGALMVFFGAGALYAGIAYEIPGAMTATRNIADSGAYPLAYSIVFGCFILLSGVVAKLLLVRRGGER